MHVDLQYLNPENQGALNTDAAFNQTSYDQYLKSRTGPYSVGKAHGLVFIALQHFDSAFKKTVAKMRSQVASDFLPERYAKDKKLLAGFKKQRDILAKQFSGLLSSPGASPVSQTTSPYHEEPSHSTTHIPPPTPSSNGTHSRTPLTQMSW
jgi:hypothetical protein